MRIFFKTALLLSAILAAPALAQASTQSTPMQPGQAIPANPSPMQNERAIPQSQGDATAANLTGQAIYSVKGRKIGTVSAMSTDGQGRQAASVNIGKYMGMDGQTVVIPVRSLQARSAGGYTTTLSATELKALSTTGRPDMP